MTKMQRTMALGFMLLLVLGTAQKDASAQSTLECVGDGWGTTPVQVGQSDAWSSVGCDYHSNAAVKRDGTLWYLANGSTTPVSAGAGSDWAMAPGDLHQRRCAIKQDGTLWCSSSYTGTLVLCGADTDDWTTTGADYFDDPIGIKTDGSMWRCDPSSGSIVAIRSGETWQSVSGGYGHWCAVRTDGALFCFFGQSPDTGSDCAMGNGGVHGGRVGSDSDWIQVEATRFSTCARRSNGTIWCWGNEENSGIYGDGGAPSPPKRCEPTGPVGGSNPITNFVDLNTGDLHAVGLAADGTVWCWGLNQGGECGVGNTTRAYTPVRFGGPGATYGAVAAGERQTNAVTCVLSIAEVPPAFSMVFAPDTVAVGIPSTLTFTIDNTAGRFDATALDLADSLPAGLTLATPANAVTTCTGGTLTAANGSAVISYTDGTVPAGSTCAISVDVTGTTPDVYLNTSGDLTSTFGNSGPASDTLTVGSAPTFSKAFNPTTIAPDDTSTLSLTIDNTANAAATTGLDFTDNLPAGMVIATPGNATSTCTGGTLTAADGSTVISYTGGTVPAGSTCAISVDMTSPTPGVYNNITGDLTSVFGNSGPAGATLTVGSTPAFSKAFNPTTIAPDDASTLTLTIDNTANTVATTGLAFTDSLPAGMVIATPGNATATCTGGTLTAADGSAVISYAGGTVPAGSTCAISVDVTSTTPGVYTNTSGDLTSIFGNSGPAGATLTVGSAPSFSKAFNPTTVAHDDASTLTLTIDNSVNVVDTTDLDFTDSLPAGMVIAIPGNATSTCSGGTLTAADGSAVISYTGGTVPAGSTCAISVDVTSTTPGVYTNTSGDLTSIFGNSGPAGATLTVGSVPSFSKAFNPAAIAPGAASTLSLTIDNTANTVDASGLDVTDSLPAGMVIAIPGNATSTCTGGILTAADGTAVISYTGGTVSAGSTCAISVDVTSTTPGVYNSTSGDLTSTLGNSGPASATLTVGSVPSFSKAFNPAAIAPGAASTLSLTIDNTANTVDATGLAFTDNLPAGMVVATPGNAVTTCTGGTLTAADGSAAITYSGGTVAAGARCTVTVNVTVAGPGEYTNDAGTLSSSLGTSTAGAAVSVLMAQAAIPMLSPYGVAVLCCMLMLGAFLILRRGRG